MLRVANKCSSRQLVLSFQVGGEASSVVYHHLRKNARVAVCGSISNYNSPNSAKPKGRPMFLLFSLLCSYFQCSFGL